MSAGAPGAESAPADQPRARACRVCGCTQARACIDLFGQPCHWAAPDLCSACLWEPAPYRGIFRPGPPRAAFASPGAAGFVRGTP